MSPAVINSALMLIYALTYVAVVGVFGFLCGVLAFRGQDSASKMVGLTGMILIITITGYMVRYVE